MQKYRADRSCTTESNNRHYQKYKTRNLPKKKWKKMIANHKASIHQDIPDTRNERGRISSFVWRKLLRWIRNWSIRVEIRDYEKYRRNQEIEIRDYKYACLDDFRNDAKQLSVRNHQRGRAWDRNLVWTDGSSNRIRRNINGTLGNHVIKIGTFGTIKKNQQNGTRSTY